MPLGPCNRWTPGRATNHTTGFLRDTPSPLSTYKVARPKKSSIPYPKERDPGNAQAQVSLEETTDPQQDLRPPSSSTGRSTRRHSRTKSESGGVSSKNTPGTDSGNILSWDRIVFVLFWASVFWLLRALAGFGAPNDGPHVCPSTHAGSHDLGSKRFRSPEKNVHRAVMLDWQGDYNMLPEQLSHPQTTTSLYLEPEHNLPAPTLSATPNSPNPVLPMAPFYDPRYDPFHVEQRLLGPEDYDINEKLFALNIHPKSTHVSASAYGAPTTNFRCRGAKTRC
ncbi:hypothetical protein NEOLEDRAFT_1136553 [Neolentinus lepideus HHB14362 ss-1]|uniref:Uncharacterized protein n=1 Tax=Neolentinus lepideus HHB14362 ss-1 TaxID=1314782 RepID=A0A165R9C1_9AGAM|nr:hypothetical protein NEOLEDRAFT_1136553 [Neolentinus lepideus HHB14362 ss-1]